MSFPFWNRVRIGGHTVDYQSLLLFGNLSYRPLLGCEGWGSPNLKSVAAVSLHYEPIVGEDSSRDLETVPLLLIMRINALLLGKLEVGIIVWVSCRAHLTSWTFIEGIRFFLICTIACGVRHWGIIACTTHVSWATTRHWSVLTKTFAIGDYARACCKVRISCDMKRKRFLLGVSHLINYLDLLILIYLWVFPDIVPHVRRPSLTLWWRHILIAWVGIGSIVQRLVKIPGTCKAALLLFLD